MAITELSEGWVIILLEMSESKWPRRVRRWDSICKQVDITARNVFLSSDSVRNGILRSSIAGPVGARYGRRRPQIDRLQPD